MKVKTAELTGISLDYAVALASGAEAFQSDGIRWFCTLHGNTYALSSGWGSMSYSPSTNWAQGGPIIESNEIDLKLVEEGVWQASNIFDDMEWYHFLGYSPLEAAMRCHVAHKLGEEVEIPEELLK